MRVIMHIMIKTIITFYGHMSMFSEGNFLKAFINTVVSHRYPWGTEAFDKAIEEDKMIFLSGT